MICSVDGPSLHMVHSAKGQLIIIKYIMFLQWTDQYCLLMFLIAT